MKISWRKRTATHYGHKLPAYDLYWGPGKMLTVIPMHDRDGAVHGRWYVSKGQFCGYFEPPPYLYVNSEWHAKEEIERHLQNHVAQAAKFYNDLRADIDSSEVFK